MSMIPRDPLVYDDGRTKQSFKDSCDINYILNRAMAAGGLSHVQRFGGVYADFSDFDFLEAQNMLARGRAIFEHLPPEIRREFGNDPSQFFAYANDPANAGRLEELLPGLAAPGRQRPGQSPDTPPAAPPDLPPEPPGDPGPPQDPGPPE